MLTTIARHLVRIAVILMVATAANAQTTYRWLDPKTGSTVISDLPPPPGARQVSKTDTPPVGNEAQIPYALRQASEKFPVVLYTSAGCVTCKQARTLLDGRGVPFSEKVLKSEAELAELGRQLGGEPALPSVSVGRQGARGFVPTVWNELLDAAGSPTSAPYRARPATAPAD